MVKLAANPDVHRVLIDAKLLPLIMATRSHADLECRRAALEAFLALLDSR